MLNIVPWVVKEIDTEKMYNISLKIKQISIKYQSDRN